MSTEHSACPPSITQDGKTAFYEQKIIKNSEHKQAVSNAMTWLRPVQRILLAREIKQIDHRLAWMGHVLQTSREADDLLDGASPTAPEQQQQPGLPNNTAANHPIAIIQHGGLAGSYSPNLLAEA